ncbi:MAG: peroxiredoxin-like family protein [Phycisphaerales bacterium]|jgi:peroxiredoxin|nr:peroxiredoxin-like family protein [Phycisphaerales bacterium]
MLRRAAMLSAVVATASFGLASMPGPSHWFEEPGLAAGEKAPVVKVKDAKGEVVSLGDAWAEGPAVVIFYRGGWCPFCNRSLSAWQDQASALEAKGVNLIAISPETPEFVESTTEKDGLKYEVYSDFTLDASRKFELLFELDSTTIEKYKGYGIDLSKRNASGTWELPHPGTFIVDREGVVRAAWVDEDYTKRVAPEVVMEKLGELGM